MLKSKVISSDNRKAEKCNCNKSEDQRITPAEMDGQGIVSDEQKCQRISSDELLC